MIEPGQNWVHLKTGGTYEIIDVRARMQISWQRLPSPACSLTAEGLEAMEFVAYRRAYGGETIYFRPREEFLDGRFQLEGER